MSIARFKIMRLFPGEDPKEVTRELLSCNTYRAIAALLGCSTYSVYKWGERCGADRSYGNPPRYRKITEQLGGDPVKRLWEMKEELGTWDIVASDLQVTKEFLRCLRRRLGVVQPPKPGREVIHRGDWIQRLLEDGGSLSPDQEAYRKGTLTMVRKRSSNTGST